MLFFNMVCLIVAPTFQTITINGRIFVIFLISVFLMGVWQGVAMDSLKYC
jgi:hypothetical protein